MKYLTLIRDDRAAAPAPAAGEDGRARGRAGRVHRGDARGHRDREPARARGARPVARRAAAADAAAARAARRDGGGGVRAAGDASGRICASRRARCARRRGGATRSCGCTSSGWWSSSTCSCTAATRGQSFVYELLYEGEGAGRRAFLPGLVDAGGWRTPATTRRSGLERPVGGGSSGPRAALGGPGCRGDRGRLERRSDASLAVHSSRRMAPKRTSRGRGEQAGSYAVRHGGGRHGAPARTARGRGARRPPGDLASFGADGARSLTSRWLARHYSGATIEWTASSLRPLLSSGARRGALRSPTEVTRPILERYQR